jgi:3-methyladenine DNA glycosylase AlkD
MKKKTTDIKKPATSTLNAKEFLSGLSFFQSPVEKEKIQRYFYDAANKQNKFLGVRFATIFQLAKEFRDMPLSEIEKLLDSPFYEARMGAVSIMDFQARNKKTSETQRKALYNLYIRRHDRINNWDLVDRSAPYVVGGYLADKSRTPLYKLAKSKNPWERRTAIVSTYYFIRQNETEDTFKIAEQLVADNHDLIHKAVGSWIREAGKRDRQRLIQFLDKFATRMPRTMLRYACEKLDKAKREYYLKK